MLTPLSPLLRYGSVVPHFDAFLESCERPLSATVRVNALRASAAEVRESLETLIDLPGLPGHQRTPSGASAAMFIYL